MSRRTGRRRKGATALPAPRPAQLALPPAPVNPPIQQPDITLPEMVLGMFVGSLAAGEYDDKLDVIIRETNVRLRAVERERTSRALAALQVGDRVAISADATPQYLRGMVGEVIGFDGDAVQVCLGRPVGRLRTSHVKCPVLALVKLSG